MESLAERYLGRAVRAESENAHMLRVLMAAVLVAGGKIEIPDTVLATISPTTRLLVERPDNRSGVLVLTTDDPASVLQEQSDPEAAA